MAETISATEKQALLRLLRFLARGPAIVTPRTDGTDAEIKAPGGTVQLHPAEAVRQAVSKGLVRQTGNRIELADTARSFLRRAVAEAEETFLAQHADLAPAVCEIEGARTPVRIDRAESPLGALARLKDRDGAPFMPEEAIAAGERLAADFMRGQLQPRVTASWEPRLASRGRGERGGMADLTDSAMTARAAVNRAIEAMGPELSGVALDVCCFMKGLETVERERQWPVRSAKLMLRTALLALSRHYAPPARRPAPMRHWGEEGFRPELR